MAQLGIISIQLSGGGNIGVIVHQDTLPAPENGCLQDDPASVLGQFRPIYSGANSLLLKQEKHLFHGSHSLRVQHGLKKSTKWAESFACKQWLEKTTTIFPKWWLNMVIDHGRIRKQAL